MKTKTVFLNKWAVLIVGLLMFGGVFVLGANAAYLVGQGLVYLLVALTILWLLGLRIHIR